MLLLLFLLLLLLLLFPSVSLIPGKTAEIDDRHCDDSEEDLDVEDAPEMAAVAALVLLHTTGQGAQ